jgi:hypothetical protein
MAVLGKIVQEGRPDFVDAAHVHPIAKHPGTDRKVADFSGEPLLDKGNRAVQKLCRGIIGLPQQHNCR